MGRRVTIARLAAAATCRRTTGAGHLLSVGGHDVAAMLITGSERNPRMLYRDSPAEYALIRYRSGRQSRSVPIDQFCVLSPGDRRCVVCLLRDCEVRATRRAPTWA